MTESIGTIALAGALLLSHGEEARAFGIEPGSGFSTGIERVKEGTVNDKFESFGLLAVEPSNGPVKHTWGRSMKLGWTTGGFGPGPEGISSMLKGAIDEKGAPFTVYNLHSHNISLPIDGVHPSKKAYSVPPSASDILGVLEHPSGQKHQYGSRSFTMRYAASDGAGVWFFNRIPTDTLQRGPLAVAYELEAVGRGDKAETPLYKWIDANAFEETKDTASLEEHVRSLMKSPLYASLVEAYRRVGVDARYVLWSDLNPNDFSASQRSDK